MKVSPERLRTIIYIGPSMNPTLRNLDKLFYAPYGDSEIKRGDVIVFDDPDRKAKVVHRVIARTPEGIFTRGDNNSQIDPCILYNNQILGRVIFCQRKDKQFKVFGGFLGDVQAARVRSFRTIHIMLCHILEWPYYYLAGRIKLPIETRVIAYQRPDGKELQLFMWGVMVGRLRLGERWMIRPPFRLFLDERSLLECSESIN